MITHVLSLDTDEEAGIVRVKRLVDGDISEIETVEALMPCFVVADPEFEPTYRKASHRLNHKGLCEETQQRAKEYEEHLTAWS